ncbi:UbiH/UbiF/VisC/COQ6 family ubiquinone biosynthesis hydroxylase [Alkalimarinus sediminis]|uniref:UbiH/UbiF/VisC/COQ6 family ubiquinone biosynthesis hydroxylase n=1 Tax=Alkalimarinus sediminis TaxID=1632866 RepID=A0A9E8KIV6_9ALTE|nr:UbiH/UbiF/VisC/COQ6 family ubiquinone biosynthesis hydroxylase [Alkalimarinus sediminis]UZW74331.1 UbiH/UbiF/VisC/COQ6 family ubiquinone biosynthesis hydroxylase [Alkalimarinus sediminis]
MSEIKHSYDIVIVGGGMVGATLACALAKTTYRVAVVESQSLERLLKTGAPGDNTQADDNCPGHPVDQYDPRVSALTVASQTFLDNLGVWSRILAKRVSPYQEMKVWDGDGTASIEFSAAELYQPALGHIVENSVTIASLYEQLQSDNKITLLTGERINQVELTGDSPALLLESGIHINASLVVAADGANSLIRKVSGLPTREWDYQHHAIVATVKTEKYHEKTAWQRFMGTGPLAFLPLASPSTENSHYSSIVWSAIPERAKELMSLSDEDFCKELGRSFEYRLGNIEAVSKRYSFPLRQRHAKQYVTANIALVGDAAHTIHPLAGQGVNLGLQDVAVLADELIKGSRRELAANDALMLKRYQRRRMGPNLAMMGLMEGFKQLFSEDSLSVRLLRNTGMRWLNGQTFLKNQVVSQAMGIDAKVPEI